MIRKFKRRQEKRIFYRTNERIFAHTVRVLDSQSKQIGVLPKEEALVKARELGLDLVEIAPTAKPPVVKIIDFKKFLYQEAKKKKEEKKRSRASETKELRLSPFINDHDLQVIITRARDFLSKNDKVKFVLKFAGRQITHPEFGKDTMQRTIDAVLDIAKIEREPHFEGKQLIAILSPERKTNVKEKNQEISK